MLAFSFLHLPATNARRRPPGARHPGGIDEPTQDDLFLDAVGAIVINGLARVGDESKARCAFFKRQAQIVRFPKRIAPPSSPRAPAIRPNSTPGSPSCSISPRAGTRPRHRTNHATTSIRP